jgi:hypothetical protein
MVVLRGFRVALNPNSRDFRAIADRDEEIAICHRRGLNDLWFQVSKIEAPRYAKIRQDPTTAKYEPTYLGISRLDLDRSS